MSQPGDVEIFGDEDGRYPCPSLWVWSGRMRGAKRLLRLSPLWLGVGYLLLIPVFATVYWLLPHGSFYDSNAQREKGVYGDAAKLRDALSSATRHHLNGLRVAIGGVNVTIKPRTVAISSLQYTPEHRLLMEITGQYGPAERSHFAVGNFAFWVEASVSEGTLVSQMPGHPPAFSLSVALSPPGGSANEKPKPSPVSPPVSLLFPPPAPSQPLPVSSSGTLTMSKATYEELQRFYAAVQGDPSYASGSWLRMLYLSAITITTLGFGDITPVSESARMSIALEAVLGIVVIGLFLNSLAMRVQGRQADGESG